MSQLLFEQSDSLRIGTVDFVSPDNITGVLDIEAPDSVALNAGSLRPFPRVNSYLLIPVDATHLVGQVEWITVQHSAFPKRRGLHDFGLIDLPYPLRKLRINPLGTLRLKSSADQFVFQRGVEDFPSVGAGIVLPTDKQLRAIVESGEQRRVRIGTSSLAGGAEVRVDPDKLFGRHLAVIGNTGSGKSCSVAGLIRWSLEQSESTSEKNPAARFIILDPNGEYSQAFDNDGTVGATTFKVDPDTNSCPLDVPLWFWNSTEWSSFTQAAAGAQRPSLSRALREIKVGQSGEKGSNNDEGKLELRRYLSSTIVSIGNDHRTGQTRENPTKFGKRLETYAEDLSTKIIDFPDVPLQSVVSAMKDATESKHQSFVKNGETIEYYDSFPEILVTPILQTLRDVLDSLGGIVYHEGPSEDMPLPFDGALLADHLEIIAGQENTHQYLDFLIARIRTLLSDAKLKAIIDNEKYVKLDHWLNAYIGDDNEKDNRISVIDLSLVPSEVVHIVTAVIARMVFEALQRHMKLKGVSLPTVLVMEEAHTFISRYRSDSEIQDVATVCCRVFERIAREGRKFGLGLVLSSQRPSELSPSVLSQCNTFLLHRISNDHDQDLVNRLVPDNLRGLLKELPSLPSQSAILLGWASELPVLVRINDLPEDQRPRSDDPEFWDVWTRNKKRPIDWKAVADDWQGIGPTSNDENDEVDSHDSITPSANPDSGLSDDDLPW